MCFDLINHNYGHSGIKAYQIVISQCLRQETRQNPVQIVQDWVDFDGFPFSRLGKVNKGY